MKTVIKTGDVEGFFKRGRDIARLADQGRPVAAERVISYEDPEDMDPAPLSNADRSWVASSNAS